MCVRGDVQVANEIMGVGRIPVSCMSYTNELYNLGQNKVEEQTPSPQIEDEVARRAKRAIFPSLIWGEGGCIYFLFILSKIVGFANSIIWTIYSRDGEKAGSPISSCLRLLCFLQTGVLG